MRFEGQATVEPIPVGDARQFETEDIFLAGSLLAMGKTFVSLHWRKGRAVFNISDAVGCKKIAAAYHQHDLKLPAKKIGEAVRFLNGVIRDDIKKKKSLNAF